MTSIARQLHGRWRDCRHKNYPTRAVNSYRFEVKIKHTSASKDGHTDEQGFVLALGGTYIKVNVYSNVERVWVLENRRAFSFRSEGSNPTHVTITDMHVKMFYTKRGHATFILAAAIKLMKDNGFQTVSIDSPTPLGRSTYRKLGFNSLTRTTSLLRRVVNGFKTYQLDLWHSAYGDDGWSMEAHPTWLRSEPTCVRQLKFGPEMEKFANINFDGYFSQKSTMPRIPEELWFPPLSKKGAGGARGARGKRKNHAYAVREAVRNTPCKKTKTNTEIEPEAKAKAKAAKAKAAKAKAAKAKAAKAKAAKAKAAKAKAAKAKAAKAKAAKAKAAKAKAAKAKAAKVAKAKAKAAKAKAEPKAASVDPAESAKTYAIESIIASRRKGKWGKRQLRVRWAGYGPQDDTWENVELLIADGAGPLVARFDEEAAAAGLAKLEMAKLERRQKALQGVTFTATKCLEEAATNLCTWSSEVEAR